MTRREAAAEKRKKKAPSMPQTCPEPALSSPRLYAAMVAIFVLAVVLYWGLIQAQKRVFPSEARLYSTPVPPRTLRHSSSDSSNPL